MWLSWAYILLNETEFQKYVFAVGESYIVNYMWH